MRIDIADDIDPSMSLPCPFCLAVTNSPCVTNSGAIAPHAHRARWIARRRRLASGTFVVRIKEGRTDERLGVKEGEEYVAEGYRLDPGKVTLLRRIPDGYDPECNQYVGDIMWARWDE